MRWLGGGCLLFIVAGLMEACYETRSKERAIGWSCFESSTSCWCIPEVDGGRIGGSSGRAVNRCAEDFSCCLLTDGADGQCRCNFDAPATCEAEADSRRDTSRVGMCPPGAENIPIACAEIGENCSVSYLRSQQLESCCDGSVCDLDETGVRTCRAASSEEESLERQCHRASSSPSSSRALQEPISVHTDIGMLTFTEFHRTEVRTGPGGCVNGAEFEVRNGIGCSLRLTAGVVGGELRVTDVDGSIYRCDSTASGSPSFIRENDLENIPFEVAIEGLTCEQTSSSGRYCTAGRMTWKLQGTVDGVHFSEVSLWAEGTFCGGLTEGPCPD